jgi:hypothetical protein
MNVSKYINIIFLSLLLVVPAFAKNTRTLKCHYFLSDFFDGDIFRNEIFETKGNNPISFSVNSYSPTDTTYSHKCEVVIHAGIREDKIYLRNFEENREWETGWYESTTEKVHNKFYKRIENGYKQSRHIIHKEEIYHGIKLYVLTPEALVIYRKLISEIRKVFTEDDIQNLKTNCIRNIEIDNDVDEKGRIIYWFLSSSKSLRGVISKKTFMRIQKIMSKTRFPKTRGLKKNYYYGNGPGLFIYNESSNNLNDVMIGKEE